ncbi:and WD repeat domain-containing 1 [Octopus vulgaris]|uniref:And WD repeat domain-containing 1 n=1 Tax=Octopus vulgaris TaxID=6645 RepID=A0AA36AR37_OCTVU|nr:and WD repeat domain-containing 1 [Octopus vulgaris]
MLKVFNTQNGHCSHVIQGIDHTISTLWANNYNSNNNDSGKGHNVGLVFIDQDYINNVVYIIDLQNYTILQILKSSDVEGSRAFLKNVTCYRQVTDDGSAMVILVERFLNGGQMQCFNHAVLWDIEHGNVQCMLVDHQYLEANSHVKSASFLPDDQSILSNHKDNVIRIFSVKSGSLLKRLEQHHSNISTIVLPNAHHCYLLSYSNEEVVFCLWRSDTFENLATIKLDEKPSAISLSAGGQVLCGRSNKNGPPVTRWTLRNGPVEEDSLAFGEHIEKFHTQSFYNVQNMMWNRSNS